MKLRRRNLDQRALTHLGTAKAFQRYANAWWSWLTFLFFLGGIPGFIGAIAIGEHFGSVGNPFAFWIGCLTWALCLLPAFVLLAVFKRQPLRASALRDLADLSEKVTPAEVEYCRTVATLIETDALTDTTGHEVIAALNSLLSGSRRLTERQAELQTVLMEGGATDLRSEEARLSGLLEGETEGGHRASLTQLLELNRARQNDHAALAQGAERLRLQQEVITQTFISLRGSLLRARLSRHDGEEQVGFVAAPHVEEARAQDVREVVTRLQQQARSLEAATRELSQMH